MELNGRIRELIAVGASITANCQPCLQLHREKALESGARPEEIAAAIEIGNRIKQGATAGMNGFCSVLCAPTSPLAAGVVLEGNGYQFLGP